MTYYKESKTTRLSDTELLEVFPETKQIVPRKLKEYKQQRTMLVAAITKELKNIYNSPNEDFRYFWRSWLKLTVGEELLIVDIHIARLSRQLRIIEGKPDLPGQLTDGLIETAQEVPIETLLDQQFRRSGHDLVGLCPFHQEKTPSFHIYRNDNRAWCFGCNKGGDVIDIVMLLHGYSFKEAVQFLTGGQL